MDGLILLGIAFVVFRILTRSAKKAGVHMEQFLGGNALGKGKPAHPGRGPWPEGGWGNGVPDLFVAPNPPVQSEKARQRAIGESVGYESQEGRASLEGMDTCDPVLGHDRVKAERLAPEPEREAPPAFLLPLTGDTLVRSVVMSEILARPGRRGWRRG